MNTTRHDIMASFSVRQNWSEQKGKREHEEWLQRLQGWPLPPINYLDCVAFCLILAVGLIDQIGLISTIQAVVWTLPFLREHELPCWRP